jgi:hypothetical protein
MQCYWRSGYFPQSKMSWASKPDQSYSRTSLVSILGAPLPKGSYSGGSVWIAANTRSPAATWPPTLTTPSTPHHTLKNGPNIRKCQTQTSPLARPTRSLSSLHVLTPF